MDYEVIIARTALRDLEKIRQYIAQDHPERARSFCQRLLDKAETLSQYPHQGAQIPGRANGRYLVMKSYLIVYRVLEETHTVRVMRYWHGARDHTRLRLGD